VVRKTLFRRARSRSREAGRCVRAHRPAGARTLWSSHERHGVGDRLADLVVEASIRGLRDTANIDSMPRPSGLRIGGERSAGASTRTDSIARRNACVPSTFPFTAAIATGHEATERAELVDRLLTPGKSRGILAVGVEPLGHHKAVLILASIVGIVVTNRAP
jgi:hypothetical protein